MLFRSRLPESALTFLSERRAAQTTKIANLRTAKRSFYNAFTKRPEDPFRAMHLRAQFSGNAGTRTSAFSTFISPISDQNFAISAPPTSLSVPVAISDILFFLTLSDQQRAPASTNSEHFPCGLAVHSAFGALNVGGIHRNATSVADLHSLG